MSLSSSLHRYFDFTSFRPGQEEAIQSLLDRQHTLVIMPTGAGKSLIFQLAAQQMEGITLVISPLIALMKDQVDALNRRGTSATYINSAIPASEQKERLRLISQGKYKIIYVAPERLRNVIFLQALQSQTLSLLAVDEAHCISEWGHDFRPDYLHIAQARRKLRNPLTVALTATATPRVQTDIVRLLGLPDSTHRMVTGFNRTNLMLGVKSTRGPESKFRALNELLDPPPRGATLIYTGTRRDAEEVAEFVRAVCKLKAEHYHAGLLSAKRACIQESFINGSIPVICATNAFGMGIDRADVRQVIHYSLPGSLEAYYQEAGRAGRDGLPARAVLLYDPQDRALQEFFIASSVISSEELRALYQAIGYSDSQTWMTIDEFSRRTSLHQVKVRVGLAELERVNVLEHLGDDGLRMLLRRRQWDYSTIEKAAARSQEHRRHREDQLNHMINFAETNACRRKIILKHFGDQGSLNAPVCCDNCLTRENMPKADCNTAQIDPAKGAALIILEASCKLKNKVGREKLAQILAGSRAKEIKNFQYDKNAYYAKLAVFRKCEIEKMINQLLEWGYFKIVGGLYPILTLTPKGETALQQRSSIPLQIPSVIPVSEVLRSRTQFDADRTVEYTAELFTNGMKPEQIAKERGLVLQTIFDHIAQLIAIGRISIEQVIPNDIREQIEKAIEKVGSTRFLSPIKSILPEEIDFNMIRCVVAAHKPPETSPNPVIFPESKQESPRHIQRIVALGESRSPIAIAELVSALKSENGNARRLAASALGKIGNRQAVQPLIDLLATETKPQVRQYAVKALGSIGDPRAVELLVEISEAGNEMCYTRDSAKTAILRCQATKPITKANLTPNTESPGTSLRTTQYTSQSTDPISAYLCSSHPRPLRGVWQSGFALDFHSSYDGADWNRSRIGNLAYRLKYQSDVSTLPELVEYTRKLFCDHPEMDQFDIILPVPSSTQRDFNPVHEFCRALSGTFCRPLYTFIMKTRRTKLQKEMHTLPQKRGNVAGVFAVNGDITDKRVLLVDDLFDSGATLEEITRLLLRHGAARVNVLTLTRTIHSDT